MKNILEMIREQLKELFEIKKCYIVFGMICLVTAFLYEVSHSVKLEILFFGYIVMAGYLSVIFRNILMRYYEDTFKPLWLVSIAFSLVWFVSLFIINYLYLKKTLNETYFEGFEKLKLSSADILKYDMITKRNAE